MVKPLKIDLPGLLIERTRAGAVFYRVRTEKDKAKRTYHHSKISNEIGKSVHRLLRDGHSARITPAITPP